MNLIETAQSAVAPALPNQRSLGLRVHTHDIAAAELGEGVETLVVPHEAPSALDALSTRLVAGIA